MTAATFLALATEQTVPVSKFVTHPAERVPFWEAPLESAILTVLFVLPGLAIAVVLDRKFPHWLLLIRTFFAVIFPFLFWFICFHWFAYFLTPNPLNLIERVSHMLSARPPVDFWFAFVPAILLIVFVTLWDDRALKLRAKARSFSEI